MNGDNSQAIASENYVEWCAVEGLHWTENRFFQERLFHLSADAPVLEIGTGGGRILFALRKEGFPCLSGIDICPRLIEHARKRSNEAKADIRFEVGNACELPLPDGSQGVVLALQQVLSLVEDPEDRRKAARELYRVLIPGGHLLASFLCWEDRWYNPLVSAATLPFKILRGEWSRLRRQFLPWVKIGFRPNFGYLIRRQPYTYWMRKYEMISLLKEAGFDVQVAISYGTQWSKERGWLKSGPVVYVAAVKPEKEGRVS